MVSIADYIVIRSPVFTLRSGGDIDRDFDFTLPDTTVLSQRAILMYAVDTPPDQGGQLVYRVTLNGLRGIGGTVGDVGRSEHLVVPSRTLKLGTKANNIEFRL